MRPLSLALSLAVLAGAQAGAQTASQAEKGKSKIAREVAKRYAVALDHFSNGRYSQAIIEWTEIVRKDPEQGSAEKMIRLAREQIEKRDKEQQQQVFDLAAAGMFHDAFIALQALLERDPNHPTYQTLERRLDRVSEIVVRAPGGSAWTAARRGLQGYIAIEDDLQLAFNGLRYAKELDSADKRFDRLIKLVLAERPSLEEDEITSGMGLIEYKRFQGLNLIYDGRYNQAIRNLQQVLQLLPQDVVSLKRMGSAFFALKKYKEAEAAWTAAIKADPTDRELHDYLARAAERSKIVPAAVEKPAVEVELSSGALQAIEELKQEERQLEAEALEEGGVFETTDEGTSIFRPRSSAETAE
jgi:predicted Zn-dependent protease